MPNYGTANLYLNMNINDITPHITPLQQLESNFLFEQKIELFVKRIDLIHEYISGNKWYKLFYNLIEAKRQNKKTLLTFGGAFSNHIYASAAAGKEFGFNTIGIIRGEEHLPLNPTLKFAEGCGMKIHYVDRTKYRKKNNLDFLAELKDTFGDFYLLPEGGTNNLAIKGCSEIIKTIDIDFNYICTPCGTGGTLAGLICGIKNEQKALGFSVLKGGKFLIDDVKKLIKNYNNKNLNNWEIKLDYYFGGYAKINYELIDFIENFEKDYKIQVEPIYTGKMIYGIFDLIKGGYFQTNSKIIILHTGGLQGAKGLQEKIEKVTFKNIN